MPVKSRYARLHLGTTIRALQAKNLVQILAKSSLLASAGRQASFLAGAIFPIRWCKARPRATKRRSPLCAAARTGLHRGIQSMTHISVIAVVALVLTAAGPDFRGRLVPNWLTLGGALVGFLPHTGTGGRG